MFKTINISIPVEELKQIKEYCKKEYCSVSWFLRNSAKFVINKYEVKESESEGKRELTQRPSY